MPDSGAPISCIAPPVRSGPRSMATSPVLLINSISLCLASASSPDVKMTVRGLAGEKSCIQSIGMLLIDFTIRAPTAISATISLDVRPFNAARDLACLIHIFEDNKGLLCYKHVVKTMFAATKEASECLKIAQHSVCCSQEFFASLLWPISISERAVPTAEAYC